MRRALSLVALALALACPGAVAADHPSPSAQARALFDDYWGWVLREFPESATLYLGDDRYPDRLRDASIAAIKARRAAVDAFRQRAAGIDDARLEGQERVSLRILRYRLDNSAAVSRAYGSFPAGPFDDFTPVTSTDGPHLILGQLARSGRFRSVRDYENWIRRLEAVPAAVDQMIERMQAGIDAGWMPPKPAIARVPSQLQVYADAEPAKTPVYAPFLAFPADLAPSDRERLARTAQRVIREQVSPAFRTLRTFYETRYLPAAKDEGGAGRLPGGERYYQALLNVYTTTALTPREIHEIGLAEVTRIGALMDATVAATGHKGTRAEFQKLISTDPRFFHASPEAMLASYRDIAKRADAELPKLFAELPRQPYGIRAMAAEEGDNSERYMPGGPGQPGWFEANANNLKSRPKWSMESLLLHEAVPGHHLQTARARELTGLPDFRRTFWWTAFGEGWALYAESLGYEMGFYTDPYQRFGNLSLEMLRACRLVVDTGLHAFGWSRERAIDYLVANTGGTVDDMTAQVDRYLLDPGQATAYKIGELRIKALRAKAREALGERFDLRRFHNAVIDNGGLPLQVLDQQIDDWIAAQK